MVAGWPMCAHAPPVIDKIVEINVVNKFVNAWGVWECLLEVSVGMGRHQVSRGGGPW